MNEVLRLLRIAKGYSISEMAEKLGKSQPFISRIESGQKTPSDELLRKYSEVLHIKFSTIMFFFKEKNENELEYEELLLLILQKICNKRIKKSKKQLD